MMQREHEKPAVLPSFKLRVIVRTKTRRADTRCRSKLDNATTLGGPLISRFVGVLGVDPR